MPFLKIEKLEKSYGAHRILHGLSLDVEQGQFVSLLGPSGSGKTTLLRCIAGLEMPDASSGEMRLDGQVLSGGAQFLRPEKRQLGMVFQNYAVWPHMTVFENVAFPLRLRPSGAGAASEIARKVTEVLGLVKLTGMETRYAHELSGGQQQRVALARALAMSPKILLLDEPLSNLDALLREELGGEIRALQQRLKLTTILVTHDQKEALSLSDRIVILDHGKIEADGTPENLYATPPSPFVAEFLSGAQVVEVDGTKKVYLPRLWKIAPSGGVGEFRIVSRIFLGSEYEYWAETDKMKEPVRFFSRDRLSEGQKISLSYPSN